MCQDLFILGHYTVKIGHRQFLCHLIPRIIVSLLYYPIMDDWLNKYGKYIELPSFILRPSIPVPFSIPVVATRTLHPWVRFVPFSFVIPTVPRQNDIIIVNYRNTILPRSPKIIF